MTAPFVIYEASRAPRSSAKGWIFSPSLLNALAASWLLAACNVPFWKTVWSAAGPLDGVDVVFLLSLPLAALLWVWLTLELLTWGRLARPLLSVVLLLSSAAAYFELVYGVLIDKAMLANVLQTDVNEASDLLSPRFAAWFALTGVAPVWFIARGRQSRQSLRRLLVLKAGVVAALCLALVAVVMPLLHSYAPLLRNHRELRLQLVPTNWLSAVHGYAVSSLRREPALEPVASDARRSAAGARPLLTVIVVGETARAANFGLNGYARETTPRLSANPEIVNFPAVRSCGTSTAVSVPCLFLDGGRAEFRDGLIRRRENLLDVLRRTGMSVVWRDNNSGCKGVCDRVNFEDLSARSDPGLCNGHGCYDEILLEGIQAILDRATGDTAVVLHMKGSHGPAYYQRYPESFGHFVPACTVADLSRCSRESIVNAYDNSLRYTDHVLARTIDILRDNAHRFDAWLVYVSDHGESLGESGVYLHGMPYALAPEHQTHVPMLLWLAPTARARFGVDDACLRSSSAQPLSHDHFFHSVIGLLDVSTRLYRSERDIFRKCRAPGQ